MLKMADGAFKKVFLSSIRPPRMSAEAQADLKSTKGRPRALYDVPFMFEAREFLRKKLIGKKVSYRYNCKKFNFVHCFIKKYQELVPIHRAICRLMSMWITFNQSQMITQRRLAARLLSTECKCLVCLSYSETGFTPKVKSYWNHALPYNSHMIFYLFLQQHSRGSCWQRSSHSCALQTGWW